MVSSVVLAGTAQPQNSYGETTHQTRLSQGAASSFCRLALNCIQKEFPNKPSHVINDDTNIHPPHILHPAFYGCFDWHSAVHGHWMLIRLLRLFPELPEAAEIRAALTENLSADKIAGEAAYFGQPNRKSFERTYGWAWLLKLAEELHEWDDPDAKRWAANLAPLTEVIVDRYLDFLPRQTYPIRTGVHPNTAFGIAFALDYARAVGHVELEELLVSRSIDYYKKDTDYPAAWEPGGEDFFSACLLEADLMRRVLEPAEFAVWFEQFLPGLDRNEPASLLTPAIVADRTDPKIVHLDGLNLSRAWCMLGIASVLTDSTPSKDVLTNSARRHADDALAHIASGHYEGEHWLASFAVYTLSAVGESW
ncbi:MAG: DUF2891 domain-containing protein [Candidatus Latescibacterota bacterium]|nr:MAG: DUF2891 domain-containing protein [Candidatus Latescibacterota bacterium]